MAIEGEEGNKGHVRQARQKVPLVESKSGISHLSLGFRYSLGFRV